MTEVEGFEISSAAARELTDKIRIAVEGTWVLVRQAYETRAWKALGYASWDDYCTREFGTSRIRLPREERTGVVSSLRDAGLSTRAIASATGLGQGTVARELSGVPNGTRSLSSHSTTGIDGKTYAPTRPALRPIAPPSTPSAYIPPAPIQRPAPPPLPTIQPPASPPPTPSPAAAAWLADAVADQRRRQWQINFLGAIHKAVKLPVFPVGDVVANADQECLEELERAVRDLARYVEEIRQARKAALPDNVLEIRR